MGVAPVRSDRIGRYARPAVNARSLRQARFVEAGKGPESELPAFKDAGKGAKNWDMLPNLQIIAGIPQTAIPAGSLSVTTACRLLCRIGKRGLEFLFGHNGTGHSVQPISINGLVKSMTIRLRDALWPRHRPFP
jgi:hypothetical protein